LKRFQKKLEPFITYNIIYKNERKDNLLVAQVVEIQGCLATGGIKPC
jgi:hypothetical protein